jgi:intracellular septation protein A
MPEKVTSLNGLKVTLEYGSYTIGAHNVYYVKCNVVLNNVIFDSCLFPHQHYDRHSFMHVNAAL